MKKATKFSRHTSDQSKVLHSDIGCPLCGAEMNAEIVVKTVYAAIYGPYASVTSRLQCGNQDCRYYERVNTSAHDEETIKSVEAEVLRFNAAIPAIGRWKKSSVSNGKYMYKGPRGKKS